VVSCGCCGVALAKKIDHTLLKPEAGTQEVRTLCEEAKEFSFAAVCIQPSWVTLAKALLSQSGVKVCCVAGFPLGAGTTAVKVYETRDAVLNGADEIDLVINAGWLKSGATAKLREELRAVRLAGREKVLKLILEAGRLTDEEKVRGTIFAREAGYEFVKTSTGFFGSGATVRDVQILKEAAGPHLKVKAAGGIRDHKFAKQLLEVGADRIGTSSSVKILNESKDACGKA